MRRLSAFLRGRPVAAVVSVVVAVAFLAGVVSLFGGSKQMHVTAYFPRTIGIYKESKVAVLGVPVGSIKKVTPEGTRVRVDMVYSAKYRIPADAGAAIIPPSVVSDRYIQLIPAYTSGPTLPDHAVIDENKTEIPLELDQIFGSLNDLNVALGPNGANAHGALSRLIDVGAANLNGNGAVLNSALRGFSQAVSTLANGRDALYGTIRNLQQFTTTIATDDPGVRRINTDLAQVAGQLAGERKDLGDSLSNLATALGLLQSFVANNRSTLTHDIHALTAITTGLVNERQAITEILDEAPLGLTNLAQVFQPDTHVLTNRNNSDPNLLFGTSNPNSLACALLAALGAPCAGAATSSVPALGGVGSLLAGAAG